jgi:hypothetical protein
VRERCAIVLLRKCSDKHFNALLESRTAALRLLRFLDTANYVRLQGGELPIRWSAIEVLNENKYTKASDVWSFGILIFEVMSRGAQPYSEFASLNEVAAQIKRG